MNEIKNIDFNKIIENNLELDLYRKLYLNILKYLSINDSASFLDILRDVGGSDRRILRLIDELINKNIIIHKDGLFKLKQNNQHNLNSKDFLCKNCRGSIIDIEKLSFIKKDMEIIFNKKPTPTFIFDQRPVTLETTLRRVAYLIFKGDIQNQKIAILGDDDLTSIAIALTKLAKEIFVFDIDKRFISFINKVSKEFNLDINVIEQDFSKSTPKNLLNYFDVFMTDPTPTKIPFIVFTNFGIRLLKSTDSVGYLSLYSSAMNKNIDLQGIINKMGLLVTDMIPRFTEYDFIEHTYNQKDKELLHNYSKNERPICFTESLVRVKMTKKTKPIKFTYRQKELFGKATRRVLADFKKDPGSKITNLKERNYLLETIKMIELKADDKLKS